MRDAIDAYVDRGGRVARFAGNFLWQIRIEDGGTKQVGYKSAAAASDPLRDTEDRHLLTSMWEDIAVARPRRPHIRAERHRRDVRGLGRLRAARIGRLSPSTGRSTGPSPVPISITAIS